MLYIVDSVTGGLTLHTYSWAWKLCPQGFLRFLFHSKFYLALADW